MCERERESWSHSSSSGQSSQGLCRYDHVGLHATRPCDQDAKHDKTISRCLVNMISMASLRMTDLDVPIREHMSIIYVHRQGLVYSCHIDGHCGYVLGDLVCELSEGPGKQTVFQLNMDAQIKIRAIDRLP